MNVKLVDMGHHGTYLGGLGISDLGFVNPVLRFLVIGIVNFFGWVHRRFEVLKKAPGLVTLAVNEYVIGVVRAEVFVRTGTMLDT